MKINIGIKLQVYDLKNKVIIIVFLSYLLLIKRYSFIINEGIQEIK